MQSTDAQFGLGKKKTEDSAAPTVNADANNEDEPLDLERDPELLVAMEIFAAMNPEEMEETMEELKKMLGDDPETLEAIQHVMNELPKMKSEDVQSSLNDMIADDEIAAATNDALKLLGHSHWDQIWEQQDVILQAVIQSGQISEEDTALFTSDNAAWEKELRFIWNELQRQAAAVKEEL